MEQQEVNALALTMYKHGLSQTLAAMVKAIDSLDLQGIALKEISNANAKDLLNGASRQASLGLSWPIEPRCDTVEIFQEHVLENNPSDVLRDLRDVFMSQHSLLLEAAQEEATIEQLKSDSSRTLKLAADWLALSAILQEALMKAEALGF